MIFMTVDYIATIYNVILIHYIIFIGLLISIIIFLLILSITIITVEN